MLTVCFDHTRNSFCMYLDKKHDIRFLVKSIWSCRSGSDEEYSEKMKLLQEINDLKEEGKIVVAQKKADKKKADKEAKKRLDIRKAGEDIRERAMQTLKEG